MPSNKWVLELLRSHDSQINLVIFKISYKLLNVKNNYFLVG
jgi:hypothetical protein